MARLSRPRTWSLLAALCAVTMLVPASATADEGTDIEGIRYTDRGLVVLVDVPPDVALDPEAAVPASLAVDGREYPTSLGNAEDVVDVVDRTTILAIDTSQSMRGAKFRAAKAAAETFLRVVPADVNVGIVTFDSQVDPVLPPTTSRSEALAVLGTLELGLGTQLYQAVIESVGFAEEATVGNVLVLSDGVDTSDLLPSAVASIVDESDVTVNAVALGQSDQSLKVLRRITGIDGDVIGAEEGSLSDEYERQAAALARQVALTAEVPREALVAPAQVEVTLASDRGALTDRFVFQLPPDQIPDDAGPLPSPDDGGTVPRWALFVAMALVAAAVLLAAAATLPAPPAPRTAEARIAGYTAQVRRGSAAEKPSEPVLTQATEALDDVLRRNQGLEERISARLTSAGSALKASEWVLLHAGIAVGASLLGLLLGRGNPAVGVLFLVAGVVVPWFWLGLRRGRRRSKFESALPETLQLMAGSLSAGLSMVQSVDTIVREGTDPVASEFRRVLVELRLGVPLDDALEGVADRFDSKDFRWVVMAIRIQRQVGGNLAELLTTVSTTIREREFIRRQVSALAAEGKLSAIVLGGLPPAFLLYLVVAQPSYVEPLFTDLRGLIMLVFSAVWLGIGVVWMSRLVKVEI